MYRGREREGAVTLLKNGDRYRLQRKSWVAVKNDVVCAVTETVRWEMHLSPVFFLLRT